MRMHFDGGEVLQVAAPTEDQDRRGGQIPFWTIANWMLHDVTVRPNTLWLSSMEVENNALEDHCPLQTGSFPLPW